METQARICPYCHDDHGEVYACAETRRLASLGTAIEAIERLINAGFEVWGGLEKLPAESSQKPGFWAETHRSANNEGPEITIWADTLPAAILELAAKHQEVV